MGYALRKLARRAHSEGELSRKMQRAGYSEIEIRKTLDELRARRYIDDAAFARERARRWAEDKCWGPARIARGLRHRGLEESDIAGALAEIFPTGEDEQAKRALIRYRRVTRQRISGEAARARAYRHLLARGFSSAAILSALRGSSREDESS